MARPAPAYCKPFDEVGAGKLEAAAKEPEAQRMRRRRAFQDMLREWSSKIKELT